MKCAVPKRERLLALWSIFCDWTDGYQLSRGVCLLFFLSGGPCPSEILPATNNICMFLLFLYYSEGGK